MKKIRLVCINLFATLVLFSCGNKTPITMMKLAAPKLEENVIEYKIPNSESIVTIGSYYTSLEEVSAYVIAFKKLPDNYHLLQESGDRAVCFASFGPDCRLYKYPYHNDNSGKYNSPYLTDGATDYFEADLSDPETGSYNSYSRGEFRIIFSIQENHEILYYTDDHYDHMSEYFNYYNGWGPWFGDNKSEKHDFTSKWKKGVVVDTIDFTKLALEKSK